jgi:hypothetical protein
MQFKNENGYGRITALGCFVRHIALDLLVNCTGLFTQGV